MRNDAMCSWECAPPRYAHGTGDQNSFEQSRECLEGNVGYFRKPPAYDQRPTKDGKVTSISSKHDHPGHLLRGAEGSNISDTTPSFRLDHVSLSKTNTLIAQ